MKFIIAFAGLMLCLCPAFSQGKKVLLNTQSPPIIFQTSLDGKALPDFYKNKILVLDFWATWCAPCIATFPHFNELSKKYGGSNVVFASITDEPINIARTYFQRSKKELDAVKLSDTSRKTGNSFGVTAIPYLVVVDKNNVVRWAGQSYELTDAMLSNIINNPLSTQPALAAGDKPGLKPQNKPIAQRALFSFGVALSDKTMRPLEGNGSMNMRGDYLQLSITNRALGDCLEELTGYSRAARIATNDTAKLSQLIDMNFRAGRDTSLFSSYRNSMLKDNARRNMILSLLGQSLKFDVKVNKRIQKHYQLVVTDTAKLHTFKSMQVGHSSFSDDYLPKFEIVGFNLKNMVINLEGSMKTIITTNVTDQTRYDLSLDLTNMETINKTMAFHGLALKEVNNEVELLDVKFY